MNLKRLKFYSLEARYDSYIDTGVVYVTSDNIDSDMAKAVLY
ncbi:hypothetical protein [Vibrio sp. WXL210]